MKKQLFTVLITAFTIVFVVSCKDDDDVTTTQPTCFDGIQNGDETGVDCGGSSCEDCVITTLSGDVLDNVTLDASIEYELTGAYTIMDGASLTIPAGTV